jgi:hypothetical protein
MTNLVFELLSDVTAAHRTFPFIGWAKIRHSNLATSTRSWNSPSRKTTV